jgi:hypothetical protein
MIQFHDELKAVRMIQMASLSDMVVVDMKEPTVTDSMLQDMVCPIKEECSANKSELLLDMLPSFKVREKLSIEDGLAFKVCRVFVPEGLHESSRQKLCSAHLRITTHLCLAIV